jgi:hypothetical protein
MQPMNHLHPTNSEFSSPSMREEEEEEGEGERKEATSSITSVPKHGVTDTISPPLLRTTSLPEYSSSLLFTNHMDDPYWLAFRYSHHPVKSSFPSQCFS